MTTLTDIEERLSKGYRVLNAENDFVSTDTAAMCEDIRFLLIELAAARNTHEFMLRKDKNSLEDYWKLEGELTATRMILSARNGDLRVAREALEGVVRVADRATVEFDAAHAALRSGGETT